MKASIEITKLDPESLPTGAKVSEETIISGVKVAIYVQLFTQQVTIVFNDDRNEMYTVTPQDITKGIILAGYRKINKSVKHG